LATALKIDPAPFLLDSGNVTVAYFTRRDLLKRPVAGIHEIWSHAGAVKLLRGQNPDGSWGKPGGYPLHHRPMAETFKRFRLLVGRYEFDRSHPAIEAAAEFLFSTQTRQGDFRGMIGDQYATYYTGEFASLLIRAGYGEDPRIDRAMTWLLAMRQDDGGWIIPVQAPKGGSNRTALKLTSAPSVPVEPDRTMPFSHNWTDMVLRAFAAHPKWKKSAEARRVAKLLKSRFFKPDVYSSYKSADYWVRFVQWWPNLLTSLESLVEIGLSAADPDVAKALRWFRDHQEPDGSWRTTYFPGNKISPQNEKGESPWVTLRIARVFKRLEE